MQKIIVAGIGPGSKSYITPAALEKIQSAKFLVGGRRALSEFSTAEQITCPVTRDLDSVLNFIRDKILIDDVVVMVSGDPGYYSLLDFLKKNFSPSSIIVIPSISSMQLAFARLSLPWHSATLLSFHGRQPSKDDLVFAEGKILGLLTDSEFNSATVSKILLDSGWSENSNIAVLSHLSYPDEKILCTTLKKISETDPVSHCILIVGF